MYSIYVVTSMYIVQCIHCIMKKFTLTVSGDFTPGEYKQENLEILQIRNQNENIESL